MPLGLLFWLLNCKTGQVVNIGMFFYIFYWKTYSNQAKSLKTYSYYIYLFIIWDLAVKLENWSSGQL